MPRHASLYQSTTKFRMATTLAIVLGGAVMSGMTARLADAQDFGAPDSGDNKPGLFDEKPRGLGDVGRLGRNDTPLRGAPNRRNADGRNAWMAAERLQPSPSSPSDLNTPPQTADELRVARAQYRKAQRIARLERNLWLGYQPLRPQWNPMPMMTSRYPARRVYVPVYVWP